MIPLIGPIVGLLSNLGGAWMKKKSVQAEGAIKIEEAKVEAREDAKA